METDEFQTVLGEIRRRVAQAVTATGLGVKPFAQRNKMGETVVRDLVKAHNKDVQLSTLAKIARGAGVPLTDLLPGSTNGRVSEQALERAIADALPGLPQDEGRRAEYLAATVAHALELPSGLRGDPGNDETQGEGESEGAAPPLGTTT